MDHTDYNDLRQYLNQPREIIAVIDAKTKRLNHYREITNYSNSMKYGEDKVDKGYRSQSIVERTATAILQQVEDIKALENELDEVIKNIKSLISILDDEERRVFELRYISCLEFPEVSIKLKRPTNRVYYLHQRGLKELMPRWLSVAS